MEEPILTPRQLAKMIGIEPEVLPDVHRFTGKPNKDGNYKQSEAIHGAFSFLRWQRDRITRQQVADYMGYSAARVNQLAREGVLQQGVDSEYPRHETIHAICRYLRAQSEATKGSLSDIRRRKLEQESQILAHQLAREEGQLLKVSVVEREWSNLMLNCRQKLLRIGNKVAPRVPYLKSEAEIEAAIQAEVDEALNELSRPMDFQEKDEEP